jgi:cyclophilin family peptidyl-prolyl cis-trans isomerase
MTLMNGRMSRRMMTLATVAVAAAAWTTVARAQETPADPVVTHHVVLHTSAGDVVMELYGEDAPMTVKNFVEHAKKGYYDGILFHRVVPGFAIQGGDPNTKDLTRIDRWGLGGESIYGGYFKDELTPTTPSYRRGYVEGTLAMANREAPNTNASQFFIMLVDNQTLKRPIPMNYTIFGRVTKGMDVLHTMEKVELVDRKTWRPKTPASIVTVDAVEVKPTAR